MRQLHPWRRKRANHLKTRSTIFLLKLEMVRRSSYSLMLQTSCEEMNHSKGIISEEYNILLMELFTTKLIGLDLQQSKLEANFTTIGLVLSQLKEQVSMLASHHGAAEARFNQSKLQLEAVLKKTDRHHILLLEHEKSINLLTAQLTAFRPLQQDRNELSLGIPSQKTMSSQIIEPLPPSQCAKQVEIKSKEKMNHKDVPRREVNEKKMAADLVVRLEALNREHMQVHGASSGQRSSKQAEALSKSQNREDIVANSIQRKTRQSVELLTRKRLLTQEEQKAPNSIVQLKQQRADIESGLVDAEGIRLEQSQGLRKDFELLRQAFNQKTRIIDASVKDCQQKLQAFDKNIDLIERSHEMLKYDFQRTSTSFSKSRTPFSESQGSKFARQEGSKQSKTVGRNYYEERLMELFSEMDTIRCEYLRIRSQMEREPSEKNRQQVLLSHQLNFSRPCESDLRRQIATCKAELKRLREEFEGFASMSNSGLEVRTVLIKPNENKQDWKSLSTRMQKLKMQLQGSVRELEGKIVTNNEMVVQINEVLVGLEECKLLLKKKVDTADYQRSIKKLEARITSFIFQICEKSGKQSQIDAALAKHPWFCLSCDSELKNYAGKTTKSHVIPQRLKGGKVNPEIHMVKRNQNGKLPSVIK